MFRVYDDKKNAQVFTMKDPRLDGFEGEVEEIAKLDYRQDVDVWPTGAARPDIVIGRTGQGAYKVFKYDDDRKKAGAEAVSGHPRTCYSWADYPEVKMAAYNNSANE